MMKFSKCLPTESGHYFAIDITYPKDRQVVEILLFEMGYYSGRVWFPHGSGRVNPENYVFGDRIEIPEIDEVEIEEEEKK